MIHREFNDFYEPRKAVLFGSSGFFLSSLEWRCCRKFEWPSHFPRTVFVVRLLHPSLFIHVGHSNLTTTRGKTRLTSLLMYTLVTKTVSWVPSTDPFVLWIILAISKNFSFIYIHRRANLIINGLYYVICRAFFVIAGKLVRNTCMPCGQ